MILRSRKYGEFEFYVDEEDLLRVSAYKWCISKESRGSRNSLFYVVGFIPPRRKGVPLVRLHRLILNAKPDEVVDHTDGNPLNNRKANLRIVTHQVNMQNSRKRHSATSQYKGVSWSKRRQKWRARVYMSGVTYELGYYLSEAEAATQYNKALDLLKSSSPRNSIDS